jgi:hypothetical protein
MESHHVEAQERPSQGRFDRPVGSADPLVGPQARAFFWWLPCGSLGRFPVSTLFWCGLLAFVGPWIHVKSTCHTLIRWGLLHLDCLHGMHAWLPSWQVCMHGILVGSPLG